MLIEGGAFIVSWASAALAVFLFFLVLFVISLIRQDNTIADIGWPLGFVIAVFVVLWQRDTVSLRQVIAIVLVSVWGVRLSLHVWLRNRGKGEDWWHKAWRHSWGEHWVIRSFLQIYLLPLVYLLLIVSPVIYINTFAGPSLGVADWVGLALWIFGFTWEVVGDHQLVHFKRRQKSKGHVLCTGLWRYSRHPNYFGEILLWTGLWVMATSLTGGWLTFVGPLASAVLLIWGRGIPRLEKHFSANPEYLAYQRNTSMLVPWFPGR